MDQATPASVSPEVVTIGESMILLLAEQSGPLREVVTFRRHIAGAESNVAIGLCRLGRTAGWISRVGDDEFGRAIVFRLRGEGVDVSHATVDGHFPTGIYFRERREVGPVDVVYYRRDSAASRLSPADLDADYIRGARYLHLTGITPALSGSCRETVFAAAEMARAAGVAVVLDPNLRLKLWSAEEARAVLRDLTSRCDVLLPGSDEAELLTGESDPERAAYALRELGPSLVVVKLGAHGSLALEGEHVTRVPVEALARVVDPVGAGDAFAAGLLSGLLGGVDIARSLQLANRCGAMVMSLPGDLEGLPTAREVADLSTSDVRR